MGASEITSRGQKSTLGLLLKPCVPVHGYIGLEEGAPFIRWEGCLFYFKQWCHAYK